MEMFLWAVGSFHVFGEKLDFVGKTLPKNPQSGFPTFQIDVQMQSSIMCNVAKGFYILEKGFYILEKGFIFRRRASIFLRFRLWRYGGLDSANSANKVG